MNNTIKNKLRDLILQCAPKAIEAEDITEEVLLIDDLHFDSISIMRLIVEIETNFSIEFSDQFLLIENLSRFDILAKYISELEEQKNAQ